MTSENQHQKHFDDLIYNTIKDQINVIPTVDGTDKKLMKYLNW